MGLLKDLKFIQEYPFLDAKLDLENEKITLSEVISLNPINHLTEDKKTKIETGLTSLKNGTINYADRNNITIEFLKSIVSNFKITKYKNK